MSWWHQKNALCYNSRFPERLFKCIVVDYCTGISPSQSARKFEDVRGRKVSRQTISNYFKAISEAVIDHRKTYPWWSMEWKDFSDDDLMLIRDIVYSRNSVTQKLRTKFRELTGHDRSVDNYIYIELLRKMSDEANGLPKTTFWWHLIRACEISLAHQTVFDSSGDRFDFDDAVLLEYVYDHIIYLFEFDGHTIFRRKSYQKARQENEDFAKQRAEYKNSIQLELDATEPMPKSNFVIDRSQEGEDKRILAAVDGEIDADFGEWVKVEDD
jgi:hypothetical protein